MITGPSSGDASKNRFNFEKSWRCCDDDGDGGDYDNDDDEDKDDDDLVEAEVVLPPFIGRVSA